MSTTLKPFPFCRCNLVVSGEIARCATLGCWVSSRNVLVPLDVPRQVAEWNTRALEREAKAEPVAWAYVNPDGECEQIEWGPVFDDPHVTPLYALPPAPETT